MKNYRYFWKLISVMLIIIMVFISIKQSLITVKEIPIEMDILKLKRFLYNNLRLLIKEEDFITLYGRSNINPMFITRYYIQVINDPNFLIDFIETLPLKEYSITTIEEKKEFLKYVESLFYPYVEKSQKNYDNNIKRPIFNIFTLSMIVDLFCITNFFFKQHADIVTPLSAAHNNNYYNLSKPKIIAYTVLIIGSFLKYITGF